MAVAESIASLPYSGKIHRWFRVLTLVSATSVFALVVLGGVVRVTDSGLGCPDWPLCHGRVLPPWQINAIIEYSHRLVASAIVGPLILATGVLAWVSYRRERWVLVSATMAVILLLGQAMLGGATVREELSPNLVFAHLALAEALLGCTILVAVASHRGPLSLPAAGIDERGLKYYHFTILAVISAVAVYLLLLTGSYVTTSGASGSCTDWPLCLEGVFSTVRLPMIHMGHRIAAAVIGLLLMYTLHLGFRLKSSAVEDRGYSPHIRYLSVAAALAFISQIAVGAAVVLMDLATSLVALHLSLATAAWASVAGLALVSLTPRNPPNPIYKGGAPQTGVQEAINA